MSESGRPAMIKQTVLYSLFAIPVVSVILTEADGVQIKLRMIPAPPVVHTLVDVLDHCPMAFSTIRVLVEATVNRVEAKPTGLRPARSSDHVSESGRPAMIKQTVLYSLFAIPVVSVILTEADGVQIKLRMIPAPPVVHTLVDVLDHCPMAFSTIRVLVEAQILILVVIGTVNRVEAS